MLIVYAFSEQVLHLKRWKKRGISARGRSLNLEVTQENNTVCFPPEGMRAPVRKTIRSKVAHHRAVTRNRGLSAVGWLIDHGLFASHELQGDAPGIAEHGEDVAAGHGVDVCDDGGAGGGEAFDVGFEVL